MDSPFSYSVGRQNTSQEPRHNRWWSVVRFRLARRVPPGVRRRMSDSDFPSESVGVSWFIYLFIFLKIIRTNEKEQLQGLNDRFVTFIEKVHSLEQQNRVLEAEVALLRERHSEPSRLHHVYEQELRELRARAEELSHEKNQMHVDCVGMSDALERAREKLDEEVRAREEAESVLKCHRKDVDDATLVRLELEKKVESLLDEVAFLRKVHEEELQELQASLQATQVSVEMDMSKPDLAAALKDIRAQYETLSAKNQVQAEDWYRSKFASVSDAASRNQDAVKHSKEELSEYRRQVQARTLEIEALRGHNEALERQMAEMEDRHGNEVGEMQDTIGQLENALRSTKGEMSRHLREYQDLLNVKMALDIEIAAYRWAPPRGTFMQSDLQPFLHTSTARSTTQGDSRLVRSSQGEASRSGTPRAGDRTSIPPVTSQPALNPELSLPFSYNI
uniref:IF rod domain-containing protein n=1 Tax=Gadus morhua TaxID=8049 RepID=A0A8C5FHU2_GADMO